MFVRIPAGNVNGVNVIDTRPARTPYRRGLEDAFLGVPAAEESPEYCSGYAEGYGTTIANGGATIYSGGISR